MDVRVQGTVAPDPFLSAADLLETEYSLSRPVEVHIRENPDERTWAAHYDDRHVLNISRQAATSVLARELALHEFAHMARYEQRHASHTQSTDEALFLGLAGESVERRKLAHCYQIANHMKDIYADDITLALAPATKLIDFFASKLATAITDQQEDSRQGTPVETEGADPEMTVVNAAFALALVERHSLVSPEHRLYELADTAAAAAPGVDLAGFKRRFKTLGDDPTESEYRKSLVEMTRAYATAE
ncbi:DUF5781 family protein [Halonotius roseus]|uniref:Uncharacterized protein n=1 Tax=Halonotius roseus TaxID=2511997 RepID=A0A544QSE8_9EURY|nr:DUF5781 family protein [Halonotius roseus]TQQ82339.1 hypothetical protein EWF95_05290 [Halonotius roseus]